MFEAMVTAIREETVRRLMLVQIRPQQEHILGLEFLHIRDAMWYDTIIAR